MVISVLAVVMVAGNVIVVVQEVEVIVMKVTQF